MSTVKKLTKTDVVAQLAKASGLSQAQSDKVLNSLLEIISNSLKTGHEVTLTGFGSFRVSKRKARTGVNPQTGEKIQIKASKSPSFRAGKNLKDALN
jgi:DNA-binding protein HU-beta